MHQKYTLITLDSTTSTNDEARRIMESQDIPSPHVILAKKQTAARGRYGRKWQALSGNLYMSILMSITCELSAASNLSFVTGLAAYDVMHELAPELNIALKWPNDIYISDDKIGGILLESFPQINDKCIIIGLGVNLEEYPADLPATSLKAYNIDISAHNILDRVMDKFDYYHNIWQIQGFSKIREIWLKRAYKIGQTVLVNGVFGVFESIDEAGAIIIRDSSGKSHIASSGEIY